MNKYITATLVALALMIATPAQAEIGAKSLEGYDTLLYRCLGYTEKVSNRVDAVKFIYKNNKKDIDSGKTIQKDFIKGEEFDTIILEVPRQKILHKVYVGDDYVCFAYFRVQQGA